MWGGTALAAGTKDFKCSGSGPNSSVFHVAFLAVYCYGLDIQVGQTTWCQVPHQEAFFVVCVINAY